MDERLLVTGFVIPIPATTFAPGLAEALACIGVVSVVFGAFIMLHNRRGQIVCRLKGMVWNRQTFCRGWFISGATGSGKTLSGIRQLLLQVLKHQPQFGALCMDDKGTLHEPIVSMCKSHGRGQDVILLQVRPDNAAADWKPAHRFNLTGDPSIPFSTYARCIVDTASSLGNRREQGFFRSAAQLHIGQALAALSLLNYEVTLANVYHVLTDPQDLQEMVAGLEERPDGRDLARHFQKFLSQPPEQREGIIGTIGNYLAPFITEEIAEVFCRDSTFSMHDVDTKIICLALPQKFQTERRYVGTMLKFLFYLHVLRRFDLSKAERDKQSLLLFLADECQHFLTRSEDGLSDHSMVDVIREAGAAFIAATQSSTSLIPVLGAESAKVFLLNLRNRMIFTAADEDDARSSAEFLGKKKIYEYSDTSGDGRRSRTRHRKDVHRVEIHRLRELRSHECILVHAEHGPRRCILPPIEPDGSVSPWFRRWRWF